MGSSGCYSCLKAMVFIVNFLVMLLGLMVTGMAIWLLVSEHLFLSSSWEHFSLSTITLLSVGLLVTILAFLGCCGTIARSKCLLGMFVISLLALLVGEVSVAVLVYFKVSNRCEYIFVRISYMMYLLPKLFHCKH